jgi:hypothetical protein
MSQEWMIEILADIRAFAERNMMADLAEQLDDAIIVAARELNKQSGKSCIKSSHGPAARSSHQQVADCEQP